MADRRQPVLGAAAVPVWALEKVSEEGEGASSRSCLRRDWMTAGADLHVGQRLCAGRTVSQRASLRAHLHNEGVAQHQEPGGGSADRGVNGFSVKMRRALAVSLSLFTMGR